MATLARREFLMQLHKYTGKEDISNFFISEKCDGTRCFWDGGVSRGVPTKEVPWANITNPKTGEPKAKVKPVATGLWSRYGNPIIAPDWFLNKLPSCLLDGELFAGRGRFQKCRSIVAGDTPGLDWDQIRYCVWGSPSFEAVFGTGEIKNPNFTKILSEPLIRGWFKERAEAGVLVDFKSLDKPVSFLSELQFVLQAVTEAHDVIDIIPQCQLPDNRDDAEATLSTVLNRYLGIGGEGCVLRSPDLVWAPKRLRTILKVKPTNDDEGTVVGFTAGRETDKGSKLLGLIGALVLDYKGQRLEISGLTDEERQFAGDGVLFATLHPGEDMPEGTEGVHFKVGDSVTFKYRELSDAGIPKDARYWRKR